MRAPALRTPIWRGTQIVAAVKTQAEVSAPVLSSAHRATDVVSDGVNEEHDRADNQRHEDARVLFKIRSEPPSVARDSVCQSEEGGGDADRDDVSARLHFGPVSCNRSVTISGSSQ
jgi:hypothetical protein